MRKVHTQALAKQDLKNIWLYSFKNWGGKQADCYFDELNAAFALIAENPELGVACDYIREGYRHFHINRLLPPVPHNIRCIPFRGPESPAVRL